MTAPVPGGNVGVVAIDSAAGRAAGPAVLDVSGVATSDAGLRQVLHGLPGVDQVGVGERVAALATRSVKKDTKLRALDLAVRMVDLTTLEGADTPGKVAALCAKARHPDAAEMRAYLDRSRRSHLAYGRRYLGWGVFVLRAAG